MTLNRDWNLQTLANTSLSMPRKRVKTPGAVACVRDVLRSEFPAPDEVELEDEDGIIGVLVSGRFRGLESMDRQNLLWQVLDRDLPSEDRRRVLMIATLTPEEKQAVSPLD